MTLQQEIIQALGAKPQIDVAGEIRRSVDFLKSYLQTYPFIKSLVLGISGGQDSTLTGKLCQIEMCIRDRYRSCPRLCRPRLLPALQKPGCVD